MEFGELFMQSIVKGLLPEAVKVIYNDPATIVYWSDGTKTVVKKSENDTFDAEKGLAMAYLKKIYGEHYYNDLFRKAPVGKTIKFSDNEADVICIVVEA